MPNVAIEWSCLPREQWNEQVGDEDLVRDRRFSIVVFGTAFDLERDGEPVAAVYGPCCCVDEFDQYIDDVLSVEMNATLDRLMGPLAWRSAADSGRNLGGR